MGFVGSCIQDHCVHRVDDLVWKSGGALRVGLRIGSPRLHHRSTATASRAPVPVRRRSHERSKRDERPRSLAVLFRNPPRRSAPELGPGSDRQCRAARPDGTDGPKVYPDGTGARRADGGGGVGLPDSLLTEPIVFPSEHGSVTARRQWCRAGCIMRTGRLLGVRRNEARFPNTGSRIQREGEWR